LITDCLYYVPAMINNNNYQYNSCVSKGICSVDPRTSSLQEILLLYLKLCAYYVQELKNSNFEISLLKDIRNLVLDTISAMIANQEFSTDDFEIIVERYNLLIPKLIQEYETSCKINKVEPVYYKSRLKYKKKTNLSKFIRMGEKEFLKRIQSTPKKINDIYIILFSVLKSISITILGLKLYNIENKSGYSAILKVLNYLNNKEKNLDKIKNLLIETTKCDIALSKELRNEQENRYGKQVPTEVSFSTTPAKSILVVGSNLYELEKLLEAVKKEDIDVYTHDKMLLAHTFPKLREYKNLKGNYGKIAENCLLDFATFPGPIVLTKYSLYNIENLYRGRLFTTDKTNTKGVMMINNYDFSPVIEAAKNMKGFKSGKSLTPQLAGFDNKIVSEEIKEKISSGKYKKVLIIGAENNTTEWEKYFKEIYNKIPSDVLIISLSFDTGNKNVIFLNSNFDEFGLIKLIESIENITELKTSVFIPECDIHTISSIIYLKTEYNFDIFIGKCSPIIINPALFESLFDTFGMKNITTPKKDIENIISED